MLIHDVHKRVEPSEQVWHVAFAQSTQFSLSKAPDIQLQEPSE